MTPCPHFPARRLLARPLAAAALGLAVLGAPLEARALDGRLDVRGNNQQGRAGAESFDTGSLRVDGSLEQTVRLARPLILRAAWRDRWEEIRSSGDGFSSRYTTRTEMPALSLNFRADDLRTGLTVDGYRRDYDGGSFGDRRDERLDWSAWLQGTPRWGRYSLRYSDVDSRRRGAGGEVTETRNRTVRGGARTDVPAVGEFTYDGYYAHDETGTLGLEREKVGQGLRYRGATRLDDGRGRASLELRTDYFHETVTTTRADGRSLLAPVAVGYVLDDTPGDLDPFEPQPTPLPALADLDRDTPTSLNIGDDTPPVREYGGDYRNLVVDFGDAQAVDALAVYVDRVVRFPEFLAWRLYTSDDPEGIDWTDVTAVIAESVYREWSDGRQGWELTLASPLTARRFKLVDVKSGPTEADLFLNELELYDPAGGDEDRNASTAWRHRLLGDAEYDLSERLTVGYAVNLRRQEYDEDARDLTGAIHTFDAGLRLDGWRLNALYALNTLESATRQNTDTRTLNLGLASDAARPLSVRAGWHHVLDRSLDRDRTTDDLSLDATWRAAPALTLVQKAGHGILDDDARGLSSRSWYLITVARGLPRPGLSIDLRNIRRWVDLEAGSGFDAFHSTEGTLRWALLPRVSVASTFRYEARGGDDWYYRNTLAWNPLGRGALDLRLALNDYRDTRTDVGQRGVSAAAVWRARPRLRLEGRIESQDFTRRGETSSPVSTYYRATWTF